MGSPFIVRVSGHLVIGDLSIGCWPCPGLGRCVLLWGEVLSGLEHDVPEVRRLLLVGEVLGVSGHRVADAVILLLRLVLLKPRWFNYSIITRNRLDPSFVGLGC